MAGWRALRGVPASNFVGWFLVGCVLFSAWAALERDDGDEELAMATYVWTCVGEVVANLVFWRRPQVALVGGTAMGAFALPALRALLRRQGANRVNVGNARAGRGIPDVRR